MSNFTFGDNVFKNCLLLLVQNVSAGGKVKNEGIDTDNVENIVAKDEIACFEQFLHFVTTFSKVLCCRGVRKLLYVGEG